MENDHSEFEYVRPAEWGSGVKMMVAINLLYSTEEKETGLRTNILKNEWMNKWMNAYETWNCAQRHRKCSAT